MCRCVFLVIVATIDHIEVKEYLLDVLKLGALSGACTGVLSGQGFAALWAAPRPLPWGQPVSAASDPWVSSSSPHERLELEQLSLRSALELHVG